MRIRDLTEADLAFLREMLYAAAFWNPERERLPMDATMKHPQLVVYHADWGRDGDVGFVAEEDGVPIGAVWYRFFTNDDHGYGFVDEQTPELSIAVVDGHRGRGVGRALMESIADAARRNGVRRLALSVNDDNPAKHLYSSLGYQDYEPGDGHGRMILEL